MSYEIAEQLDAAADAIEQRGWTSGAETFDPWTGDGGTGPLCLEGGIAAALGYEFEGELGLAWNVNTCPAGQAVREFLGLPEFNGANYLYGWNDTDERKKEEVLDALRGAAKYQRMKEDGLV